MRFDVVPEQQQKFHVRLEFGFGGMFGNGADNEAGPGRTERLDFFPQFLADILVFDLSGYADMIRQGHEDKIAAGQGNVTGQAGPLGADGLLGDLDQNVLAFLEQIVDARLRLQGRAA